MTRKETEMETGNDKVRLAEMQETLKHIAGATADECKLIAAAVRSRRAEIGKEKPAARAASYKPKAGDAITLQGITPGYLNGARAEIATVPAKGSRYVVVLKDVLPGQRYAVLKSNLVPVPATAKGPKTK